MSDELDEVPIIPPLRTFTIRVRMSAPMRGKPLPLCDEDVSAVVGPTGGDR